ncbi:MAG: glycerate kinase type-2 family protein [Pseudomonadota bacterium]
MTFRESRSFLQSLFQAAVSAADPLQVLPPALPERPSSGRCVVVGAGKAAASMAQALEKTWGEDLEGIVITRYDHGAPCRSIEVVEAAHPVPDEVGQEAARRILELAESLEDGDTLVCLISGGGSALLSLPAKGISLEDKRSVNKALLRCGADIAEINCVRKHLSAIKGGRLAAAAAPAKVLTFAISDVPGDEPGVIASGPTVADSTTYGEALAILRKYRIEIPNAVRRRFEEAEEETPKPGDPRLELASFHMIATPQDALEAAADQAREAGITPLILGNAIEGEARELGRVMAGIARQVQGHGQPAAAPCVLLSGGETTVTVRGQGRGGRNLEFLLSMMIDLQGQSGVLALACDTDGLDGTEDNAGALFDPESLRRAKEAGLTPSQLLEDNDAYWCFATLDDLIMTGPTLTNVNDFRAVLILPEGKTRE